MFHRCTCLVLVISSDITAPWWRPVIKSKTIAPTSSTDLRRPRYELPWGSSPEESLALARTREISPSHPVCITHRVNRAKCIKVRTTAIRTYDTKIRTDGSFTSPLLVMVSTRLRRRCCWSRTHISISVYRVFEDRRKQSADIVYEMAIVRNSARSRGSLNCWFTRPLRFTDLHFR